MPTNPIDLTTLDLVASWLAPYSVGSNPAEDQVVQDCITAFSAYVLRTTARGPMDGTIPATSPFVTPVTYDEFYDGTGTYRQPIRNWPITAVTAVLVNGSELTQSNSANSPGWVVDGDKRFISIRGGYNASNSAAFNYGWMGLRGSGFAGIAPGGFCPGIQNVEVKYSAGFSGTPFDLEFCARKVVSLNYKRRSWIGQRSQAMAGGAGTVSYNDWEMNQQDRQVLEYYKVRIS